MKTKLAPLKALALSLTLSMSALADTVTLYPTHDMWFSNSYHTSSQNNSFIKIGGWGYTCLGCWRFDVSKIPVGANVTSAIAYMSPYTAKNSGFTPVSSGTFYLLTTPWAESGTSIWSIRAYNLGTFPLDPNYGVNIDFRGLLDYWKVNSNHGFSFGPGQVNNNFYFWPSRESGINPRPRLVVNYTLPTLQLKLPFAYGTSWKVNTQAGGWNGSSYETTHQGVKFYSIDFGKDYKDSNGKPVYYGTKSIPIYAAQGGVINASLFGYNSGAGNYVKIDHDGDNNTSTGFQTSYQHLSSIDSRIVYGNTVKQGQLLGYMGSSGNSSGPHLHFEVRYQNQGDGQSLLKSNVFLEGILITSYKHGQFYKSTNSIAQ